MAEWLYSKAGELKLPDPDLWIKMKRDELGSPVRAFIANTSRTHALWKLNPHFIETATAHLLSCCRATYLITGQPFPEGAINADETARQQIQAKLAEEIVDRFAETGDLDRAAGYDFTRALANFELLLEQNPEMDGAVRDIFSSQLIGAWTAWETLAGDLWKMALNLHPATLVNLLGLKRRIEKKVTGKWDTLEPTSGKRESPEITISMMAAATDGSFDARDKMGTILKEKFSFQRLSGIREAYSAAFSRDSDRVDSALADTALDKLNLIRNVLLHNAGVVDRAFLDGANNLPWNTQTELDKPIPLNGEIVRDLINPVLQLGVDLIHAVDGWIATN